MTRSALKASFDAGEVTAHGRRLKPSLEVDRPMTVDVVLRPPAPLAAVPEPVPLSILHEDPDVLVLDKPAGVVVHPSIGHAGGTLVNGVLHHLGIGPDGLPVLPGNDATRPGVVHRLDKDTSGVIVFTKTPAAAVSLSAQFQAHSIDRRYVAVLSGLPRFVDVAARYAARARSGGPQALCTGAGSGQSTRDQPLRGGPATVAGRSGARDARDRSHASDPDARAACGLSGVR